MQCQIPEPQRSPTSAWSQRYGKRHGLVRVLEFPLGIDPPGKVRIYRRLGHYVLQWWDKARGRTLNERVEGDLLAAIMRSRAIDEALRQPAPTKLHGRPMTHQGLVDAYQDDLERRVEAGELTVRTRDRYASALSHYLAFVNDASQPRVSDDPREVGRVFALGLSAFLSRRVTTPNGHPHAQARPLTGTDFVVDTVRAMYEWAADPLRGARLPDRFANPFLRSRLKRRRAARDAFGEPDITAAMAQDFVRACDDYALRVMSPIVLYGLRPSEAIFLFREHIDPQWVGVPCIEELGYLTKGARNKKLPRLECLVRAWGIGDGAEGLVLPRRAVFAGDEHPPLLGGSLDALVTAYRRRCRALDQPTRRDFERCRDGVIADTGGLTYGHLQREFRRVARRLGWPGAATLKDFRHLFSTSLANGGVPEHERRYLMGHAPGRDAIAAYTHLNRLQEHFHAAMRKELGGVLAIVERRLDPAGSMDRVVDTP